MVLMNLKIDNYMEFNDFEINMSYPKKIIGDPMVEYLVAHPNFRYRKLNILMGSNASGKTSIGKMMLSIFNLIDRKEYTNIVPYINDPAKDAFFEIQFVINDRFYCVSSIVKGIAEDLEGASHSSDDFLTKVETIEINKTDTYEKCLERLRRHSFDEYSKDFIRELEKVEKLSWAFEFPRDSTRAAARFMPKNEDRFLKILGNTLQALDPSITDVVKVAEVQNTYAIKLGDESVIIKDGVIVGDDKLSSGTKEGISLSNMYAALASREYSFFYCDEKFSYIHSDIEKAFLSLMVQKLEGDCQLFFTTHNTDILDMDFPKHSFNFLRKEVYGGKSYISVENAGEFIKKNTDSVKNAFMNDLFSAAPMLEKIFAMADI